MKKYFFLLIFTFTTLILISQNVTDPKEIKAALKRAVESGMPYVVDVVMERDTDCSMGVSIDAIREFE